MQLRARMEEMASHSRVFPVILRGAGAYHHYIPSIVKTVSSREEFVTAYTPYQQRSARAFCNPYSSIRR